MSYYDGMYAYGYSSNTLHPISEPDNGTPYGNVLLYKCKNVSDFKETEDAYLDRMKGWKPEEYQKASKLIGNMPLYRVNGKTVEEVEKFLTAYNGYQCKLLEASENLGYDGYHYTYLRWAKVV